INSADGVASEISKIMVEARAGRWDYFQQRSLDVPVVVEPVGYIELEAWRLRMRHRAAREHAINFLADAHGVVDAEKVERVLVGNEEQVRIVHRTCPDKCRRAVQDGCHSTGVKSNWRPAGA